MWALPRHIFTIFTNWHNVKIWYLLNILRLCDLWTSLRHILQFWLDTPFNDAFWTFSPSTLTLHSQVRWALSFLQCLQQVPESGRKVWCLIKPYKTNFNSTFLSISWVWEVGLVCLVTSYKTITTVCSLLPILCSHHTHIFNICFLFCIYILL